MKDKKCVVVGVSGGVAVYKALDVISRLRKKDVEVHVIMTKSATEFVTPLSFQSLSQNMVITDMFAEPKAWEIQHISLAKKADLMLIVPATANIIGKVANGIADDMLSTTIMATKAPVVFCPAMNTNMYENPIVQRNISLLKELGYEFIEPAKRRNCAFACQIGFEWTNKKVWPDYVANWIIADRRKCGFASATTRSDAYLRTTSGKGFYPSSISKNEADSRHAYTWILAGTDIGTIGICA